MRGHVHTILGGCVIVLAAAAGCYTAPGAGSTGARPATTTESSPTETASAEAAADLPCDVASVLASTCNSCHGATLKEGVKSHLLSHADLTASLGGGSSSTIADLCIARMKDKLQPMPPSSVATDAAIATLEKWVAAGMPAGTCSAVGIDYSTPSVCTSNKRWTKGDNHGDEEMTPGQACVACHKQVNEREARIYTVAGTIFPTAHEPDDCYGSRDGKTQVIITDATGKTFTLDVNAAGNFMDTSAMKKPLHAKVKRGNAVYEMITEIKDGDCNGCHTETGRADEGAEYAAGRIVAP